MPTILSRQPPPSVSSAMRWLMCDGVYAHAPVMAPGRKASNNQLTSDIADIPFIDKTHPVHPVACAEHVIRHAAKRVCALYKDGEPITVALQQQVERQPRIGINNNPLAEALIAQNVKAGSSLELIPGDELYRTRVDGQETIGVAKSSRYPAAGDKHHVILLYKLAEINAIVCTASRLDGLQITENLIPSENVWDGTISCIHCGESNIFNRLCCRIIGAGLAGAGGLYVGYYTRFVLPKSP